MDCARQKKSGKNEFRRAPNYAARSLDGIVRNLGTDRVERVMTRRLPSGCGGTPWWTALRALNETRPERSR